MSTPIGIEQKLYRNTGSSESPTWTEVTNIKDLSYDLSKGEADITTRASGGWKSYRGTLKDFNAEFQMVYKPTDTDYTAIETAFLAGTAVEFAFADGPIATVGTKYLRIECEVFGFKRSEENESAVMVDVTLKKTGSTVPTKVTVAE